MKMVFYRKRDVYPIANGWEDEITRDPEWIYCDRTYPSAEKVNEKMLSLYEVGPLGNLDEIEIQILFEKEL